MRKLAVTLVVLVALTAMARAVPYLFATEYLPYHAQVAGRAWSDVDPRMQVLLVGMVKVIGAGNLAVAVALLLFGWQAFKGAAWAAWAVLAVGACLWGPSLFATVAVRAANPQAQTPVGMTALAIALLALAAGLFWFDGRRQSPAPGGGEATPTAAGGSSPAA